MWFVLIISVCATCREMPGTCQEKPTSPPVALQREMGMSDNPVWLLSAPGISTQWYQALNTQKWPLAHLLPLSSGRQSSWFSQEADAYRALHQPTPKRSYQTVFSFLTVAFRNDEDLCFSLESPQPSSPAFSFSSQGNLMGQD